MALSPYAKGSRPHDPLSERQYLDDELRKIQIAIKAADTIVDALNTELDHSGSTSGQVFTSTGPATSPTWQALPAPPTPTVVTLAHQGRLTLTSGNPVLTSSVAGATTVYYVLYTGDRIALWDGSKFVNTVFTELSQATTDTTKSPAAVAASKIYDLFVWSDAGTPRCTRGFAWSSDTTRGTGVGTTELQWVNGILTNKFAITNGPAAGFGTYVGSIRSNASSTVDFSFGGASAGGTAGWFGVWNMYNRRLFTARVDDTTAGWTLAAATPRITNNSSSNRINFLSGVSEDVVEANYFNSFTMPAVSGAFAVIGLGLDATTAFDHYYFGQTGSASILSFAGGTHASFPPQFGWHYITGMEASDGTHTTTFNGTTFQGARGMNLEVSHWA